MIKLQKSDIVVIGAWVIPHVTHDLDNFSIDDFGVVKTVYDVMLQKTHCHAFFAEPVKIMVGVLLGYSPRQWSKFDHNFLIIILAF